MPSTTKSLDRHAAQHQHLAAATSRLAPALVALLFGGFMIFGVGFANSAALHDAAHDGRHALSFPCH
jgi:cobalt transporter subunit CbtB